MFVRVKNVGPYQYLQIAQNRRQGKRVKQSVIATLGRLDKLTASGAIDQLLRSAARFPACVRIADDDRARKDAALQSVAEPCGLRRRWPGAWCSPSPLASQSSSAR